MHAHAHTDAPKNSMYYAIKSIANFFTILLPLPGKDTIFKHKMGVQADLRA